MWLYVLKYSGGYYMIEKLQVGDFQQGLEIKETRKGEETQIVFVGGEIWLGTDDAKVYI